MVAVVCDSGRAFVGLWCGGVWFGRFGLGCLHCVRGCRALELLWSRVCVLRYCTFGVRFVASKICVLLGLDFGFAVVWVFIMLAFVV